MALAFFNPILSNLPDGAIYDPITGIPANGSEPTMPTIQQLSTQLADTGAGSDIQSRIDAAKATRNKLRETVNAPGIGPKAKASRQAKLAQAEAALDELQLEKRNMSSVVTEEDDALEDDTDLDLTSDPNRIPFNIGGGSVTETAASAATAAQQDLMQMATTERRQSAFEVMRERFTAMGLSSLANEIEKIFKGEARTKAGSPIPIPTSESGFYLALVETQAYYDRFGKVNEQRIKSGYTALDERTILGMEDEYQKVMKAYNMPAGFYDTPEDYQIFLANDLSELELADRLQASRQFAATVDPVIKTQLKSIYNIDETALSAFIADPQKGQQLLNQLATKSLTGAAAILSGLTQQAAEVAAGFGAGEMRFQEQQRRFGQAATLAERGQFLSEIDRTERAFGEQEAVEVAFGGLEQSIRAAERLASRERARFGGAAGTTVSSFTRPTAGQF